LNPTTANKAAPPMALHEPSLIFSQSIRHLSEIQIWNTRI
jgi:hypothetical protein